MEANVLTIISFFCSGFFVSIFCVYCWNSLSEKKTDWKNYKILLTLLIATAGGTVINYMLPHYLKIISTLLLLILTNYIFVLRELDKSVITTLISQFIIMISEFILVVLMSLLFQENIEKVMGNVLSPIILNLLVAICSIFIVKIQFIKKFYNYIYKIFKNVQNSNLIGYCLLIILLASIFMITTYMRLPSIILLICNTSLTILYIVVIIKLANISANYKIINGKYETSLSSLKEYEDIMDKYKMSNHENKNQLLTIRNMVKSKDKNIIKYIDNLVKDKINDNETIFYKTSKIPEGGLRATIYSKLCKMDELSINYVLDISNDVRAVDLIKMGEDTNLDICKIIGVFLDNSIEAVANLSDKEIMVELFIMDNYLCIDISNTYNDIKLEKFDDVKYSTKGKNHGYGLQLVKTIIRKNNLLENERMINQSKFTQRLKIKM